MPSAYLQSGDLATYGVPGATPAQITQASALIDMHLKRPEGLIWTPDATGQPCFMAAANPTMTLTAPGAIAAGANVVVPVTGPLAMAQVGDTLILDRANPIIMEAVTIVSMTPTPASITLRTVANAHSAAALLEAGMVIQEEKFMPNNRPITNMSRTPMVRITSGSGRYGYARRGDNNASSINDFNLLASLSKFGGPPVWEVFDPATADYDAFSGQTWIPAGIMLAYYTEVKVRYLAGFTVATLPSEVKMACAMLVSTIIEAPNLGAVRSYRAGDTAITRFSDTMISGDVRALLQPYQARVMV